MRLTLGSFVFVQGTEPVTLIHLGTHPTGLQHEWYTSLMVMPSGKVVVYSDSSDEPYRFHLYSGSVEDWRKLKQLPRLCEHAVYGENMVQVRIGDQVLLAVSCRWCEVIRLLNLETGESSTAFRDPRYTPYILCEGEEGQIFVECRDQEKARLVILLLKCSSQNFKSINKNTVSEMCYIPQHKLIVSCSVKTIWGTDCESGKPRWKWEFGQGINSVEYCPKQDALLVSETKEKDVSVLNASDGELRQELRLPGEVGCVWGMRLHNGQLVVLYGDGERKVSFFSLQ